MPDAITAATLNAVAPPSTPAANRPDQFGKDTFLKLLVAQLKYQNPSDPADSGEFLAQTAQFTMVEKLEQLVKQNEQVLAGDQMTAAAALLGRSVTYTNAAGTEATGVVQGARFSPLGAVLVVGTDEVPITSIREVGSPAAPAEATTPAGEDAETESTTPAGEDAATEATEATDPAGDDAAAG